MGLLLPLDAACSSDRTVISRIDPEANRVSWDSERDLDLALANLKKAIET